MSSFLWGVTPQTLLDTSSGEVVVKSRLSVNVILFLALCSLLIFPATTLHNVSGSWYLAALALFVIVACSFRKTISVGTNRIITVGYHLFGFRFITVNSSLDNLRDISIKESEVSVRYPWECRMVDVGILRITFLDGSKITLDKTSDFDYLNSIIKEINFLWHQ